MLSAILSMQQTIRLHGTMLLNLMLTRAFIWGRHLCRSWYMTQMFLTRSWRQEGSQPQQQYQDPQYQEGTQQENGYTEEQVQQFNEFGNRMWEDAKDNISEELSEGLGGFLSPGTIEQGLELGKSILFE